MIQAGVVGFPIEHSLSPRLHGFWLKEHGIEGEYARYEVKPERLADFLEHLPVLGLAGCNLTLPHKEAALALMDELEPSAKAIGAVNTVVVKDGRLIGSNTDAYGFIENLKHATPLEAYLDHVVILGAGGATKAVAHGLWQEGAKKITLLNRTREKAEAIATSFGGAVEVGYWGEWEKLKSATMLVNTTSLGMQGKEPLTISLNALPETALVTDIVYTPLKTPLLLAAEERGNKVVDGLGMLLHQAVPGFATWFGATPRVTKKLRDHVLGV